MVSTAERLIFFKKEKKRLPANFSIFQPPLSTSSYRHSFQSFSERVALAKYFFNFFQWPTYCYGVHEIDLEEGRKVKRPKDKVRFPDNSVETRRNSNARAVINAQLDAWRKDNDDDHEYRGNLGTHCSKSDTAFPQTFREYCRHVNGVSGLLIWVRQDVWYIPAPRRTYRDRKARKRTHKHASTKVNSNLRIRHLPTVKKIRA